MLPRAPDAVERHPGDSDTLADLRFEEMAMRNWLGRTVASAVLMAACAIGAVHRTVSAQTRPQSAGTVAIRGGTILTATRGTIQNGVIVLRDGKIAAVGQNVPIPAGAEVV